MENSSIFGNAESGAVPAVERALDVLELLEATDDRLTLSEITRRLNLPKGSAHRLLTTLRARGYVEQRGGANGRGGYALGARLVALAARSQGQWDVARAAHAPMTRLSEVTGEGCQLSVRSGNRALCVARVPSPSHPELSLLGGVGSAFPLHAVAVGKALLAWASNDDRAAFLATAPFPVFTAHTITEADALHAELDRIRHEGIARDREEYKRGLRAVAAPVFAADGPEAVAAIALPLLAGDDNNQNENTIEAAVRTAAAEASRALGYRGGI